MPPNGAYISVKKTLQLLENLECLANAKVAVKLVQNNLSFIYSSVLAQRVCESLNKIGPKGCTLALGPHNDNNIHKDRII